MADFFIVPGGYRDKTIEVYLSEFQESQRSALGADINTQADELLGVLNGIFGDKFAELSEALGAVYRAGHPDTAEDEAQDALYALNGLLRLAAASSVAPARMNLGAGITLPAGSVARIGSAGEQWTTKADAVNANGFEDTVDAELESSNLGVIIGNAYSIDSIAVPVAGWTANAAINTLNSEPFVLADGLTLLVENDEGAVQTITFLTADFVDPLLATAAEVALKVSTLTGATAIDAGGTVRASSDTDGPGSAIRVVGGTANEALGFPVDLIRGLNPSRSAKNICGNAEPYALIDNQRIFVKPDRGSTQTIIVSAGQFPSGIGTAPAREVAAAFNASLVGMLAYEVGGKVQIESLTSGVNSAVEVTGGDANPVLGFQEGVEFFGSTGDAAVGHNIETNNEFRFRREEVLRRQGSAMVEGIKADIALVTGVSSVKVYENDTEVIDSEGRPPKSVEAVVVGGDDADIAQALFDSKAGGIKTFRDPGSQGRTEPITDTNAEVHDVNFNRPEDIQMFIEIDISVNQNVFGAGDTATGEQLVKESIKEVGDAFGTGGEVIVKQLECSSLPRGTAGVPGIIDITGFKVDDVFVPVNTANFPIDARQRAIFATADIVVNTTFS